jgi:hypothetical protein
MAALFLVVQASEDENCSVSWCCSDLFRCHVTKATGLKASNCICECEKGYFSALGSHACAFCGGHGKSINETSSSCDCENKWTNTEYCNVCPSPYGGDDCNRCENGTNNETFPDCDECAEGYFYDPSGQTGMNCIPEAMCNVDYCVGDNYPYGAVHKAYVVNKTCMCNCEDGWYGEYNNDFMDDWWGACNFCSGHGAGYGNGNCTCAYQFMWESDPRKSCRTCDLPYNVTTCDQCATPVYQDMHYTEYPECRLYYTHPDSYLFTNILISTALVLTFLLTFYLLVNHCCKKQQRSGNYINFRKRTSEVDNPYKIIVYQDQH